MTKTKVLKKSRKAMKKGPTPKTCKRTAKKQDIRRTRKKKNPAQFMTLAIINEKLSQLEKQALKAYECVQAIRKRSTPDWKEWINKLSPQDWQALASAQRDRISVEIRQLSDEILGKLKGADILSSKDKIFQDAKYSLEDIISKIDDCDLVNKAIDTAIHTKDGLLAFLNIPTHEEMIHLQRKLNRLERKLSRLS